MNDSSTSSDLRLQKLCHIEHLISKFERGIISDDLLHLFPELSAKLIENQKLKYRLEVMKRSLPKPKKPVYLVIEDFGDSLIERLCHNFSTVVNKLFPDLDIKVSVKETSNLKFGDYQFDMSPLISNKLQAFGISKSTKEIANSIADNLPKNDLIEKVTVVSNYVNIYINRRHISQRMVTVFKNGVSIPKLSNRRVVIDYSSPNVAKQMHVGHLRSTIIGDSIARLLDFVGFSVLRINHIGDWGTQFGMLIAYLKLRFPNYLIEPPELKDLQQFYKESKALFDVDKEFEKQAKQCVVLLQNHEPDITKAWTIICAKSREDFETIYKRLDVKNLVERGESYYQERMVSMIEELESEGVLVEEEGRKLFFPKSKNIPLTLVKSDGGFTYDTSDMACIKQRLFEEHADWILYVVDKGQSEHLESLFAAARDLKWYDPNEKRVEHVPFGLVLGADKKKSSLVWVTPFR